MTPQLILMIAADQLRADHVGFGGLDLGHSPHLDRLAADGVVFDRAHATNPVCMPSRATLATGRWPSAHGTRTNGIPLDPTAETVMAALGRAGWRREAVGKLHYQTMGWPFEPFQIAEIEASNAWSIDPDLRDARRDADDHDHEWERNERHRAGFVAMPSDYYGFGEVDLVVGHGDRASGHYVDWLRRRGVDVDAVAGHRNAAATSALWGEVWQTGLPAEHSTSAYVAERSIARIEAAAARDEPTFLFVSFPDPHHPFCPPVEFADICSPDHLALPSTFHQSPDGLPPHIRKMLGRRGQPHRDETFTFAVTEAQYREAMVAQIGLIAMIDHAVGEIVAAVERVGLADETVTLFTSDHGDHLGSHGLMLKQHVHYEAVTRVPLVVSGTGSTGRAQTLVSNADVAPTILDLAGVAPYRGIQGRSVLPVVADPTSAHRDAVIVEEDQPVGVDGLPAPVRMRTLITDEGRLTLYHGQPFGELYDFADDPDETTNRYGVGAELERRLRDRLLDEMLTLADEGRRVYHGA